MAENLKPFSFESGLSGFNNFLEFPDDKKAIVLHSLETASIPSGNVLYKARELGSHFEWLIECAYGDAADDFAHAIDPSFKGWMEADLDTKNSEETIRLRSAYYGMIRLYDSAQIAKGVSEIKRLKLVAETNQT